MIIDLLTLEERKYLSLISFKEGEILFYENDVCDSLGIVLEGEVTISSITFSGNELVYNRLTKGMMFGNNLLFSIDNKYRGDVKASKRGSLYLIKKDNLVKILMNNEEFLRSYLSFQADFTRSLNSQIKLLSFTNAKERFLYYLFMHNNNIKFKSVTSLASSLFLSREATSRLISQFEKEGVIKRKKNEIILLD